MNKEIITKNKKQLNYIYGQETVDVLENAIKQCIKSGNCVTVPIDELDQLQYKHIVISKIKLFFKRLFKRL